MPDDMQGIAYCTEAWMVLDTGFGTHRMRTAERLAAQGRLSTHPDRREIRFVYGLLIDGTSHAMVRPRGDRLQHFPSADTGSPGAVPDALAAVLAAVVRRRSSGPS